MARYWRFHEFQVKLRGEFAQEALAQGRPFSELSPWGGAAEGWAPTYGGTGQGRDRYNLRLCWWPGPGLLLLRGL